MRATNLQVSKILWIVFLCLLSIPFLNCSTNGSSGAGAPLAPNISQSFGQQVLSKIDLNNMLFSSKNLKIFESSNFYPGIRTDEGHRQFVLGFPTHNIVRVTAYEWALTLSNSCVPISATDYSNCMTMFKNGLEQSRLYLDQLTNYNKTKILMVDIFRVPNWLSSHPSTAPGCFGGLLGEVYRPKDYLVWQQVLATLVEFIKSVNAEAKGTQIYYQFWNEPEQACNWKEGTAELLQLYSQTAPYIKSIHPSAKIGGPGSESWTGIVDKDVNTRPQNLVLDFIQFSVEQNLPLDFITFHYFSSDYRGELIDGVTKTREFQAKLGIQEANQPIIINEWLPQDNAPSGYNPFQAADGANFYLALDKINISGQGGVDWQDYGNAPEDAWGIVGFDPVVKKPLFYVYKFFDELSRTSLGINHWSEDINSNLPDSATPTKFKIGERSFIISKEKENACYKLGTWNRLGDSADASIAYLLSAGMLMVDFQSAYGTDPVIMKAKLISAIKNSKAPTSKWDEAFKNAKFILTEIDSIRSSKEYNYEVSFSGLKISSASGMSHARKDIYAQSKIIRVENDTIKLSLFSEEVSFLNICF